MLSALLFSPRGGSAHVARALAANLPAHGWEVTLVSGSQPGHGDARAFYAGLNIHAVDFSTGDAPLHPSYEDRPGAPDRVFARVDDDEYEEHVEAWSRALEHAGAADHDVLHLNHLTPLHEAAARVAPEVPVVTHLHGTELLMLEAIVQGADWPYGDAWAERMRRWAQGSERLLVLTPSHIERAAELLGVEPERCVVSPNGFDPDLFVPRDIDRRAFWRRHLVEEPKGWKPGAPEGSVRYTEAEVEALAEGPVMVAVGRFTAVKRLPQLIDAWARAWRDLPPTASLVLVGGHPGEYEGEHPLEAIERTGARNVFLAGWHGHDELPEFLSAADVQVLNSAREQFGAVLVEGMACGLPAIAVNRLGPAEIVDDGHNGWLVEPDDADGLVAAIVSALGDEEQRRRRSEAARRTALDRYSWPAISGRVAEVLQAAVDHTVAGAA